MGRGGWASNRRRQYLAWAPGSPALPVFIDFGSALGQEKWVDQAMPLAYSRHRRVGCSPAEPSLTFIPPEFKFLFQVPIYPLKGEGMNWLLFFAGLTAGTMIGIVLMCLFFMVREAQDADLTVHNFGEPFKE